MSENLEKTDSVNKEISEFLKRCDDKGNNLLHYVVKSNDEEFAKKLIAAGCDVNNKNKKGESPLLSAIRENRLGMVKILLAAGSNCKCDYLAPSCGPLQLAAYHGFLEIIRLLLDFGVDVNDHSENLRTALHFANVHMNTNKPDNYCEIIKTLINAGANINAVDRDNYTPLLNAFEHGHYERFELLLSIGADICIDGQMDFRFLKLAALSSNLNTLKRLFELGYDVNMTDDAGNSSLHIAASNSDYNMLDFLFSKGAVININDHGCDPLYYSLEWWSRDYDGLSRTRSRNCRSESEYREMHAEQMRCVNILIKHGANVNYVAKDGMTPLYIVIRKLFKETDFVQILLNNGAKLDFSHDTVHRAMYFPSLSKVPHLLVRHTVMFQAQNREDGPRNFDLNKMAKELKKYYASCQDELETMKTLRFDDTNVTYFNVLVDRDIGPYTRNENIRNALEESDLSKRFPIYCDSLRERFLKEVEFQEIQEKASSSLCYIFNWDRNSTHLLLDNILRYLDEKDLASLALI